MSYGQDALNFLKENATINEEGNAHVTQKQYTAFMSSKGVTKEALEAKIEADKELLNGCYLFANENLKGKVEAALKNGGDASKETAAVTINIPGGSINMVATAAKTYPVPSKPGESTTKTNVVRLDIKQQRMLEKELCEQCEQQMAKLLGI